MPLVKQTFLKPGRYRVGYDADGSPILRDISAADLKRYADNTSAALNAGIRVPLYDQHAPVGKTPTEFGKAAKPKSALSVRGWLTKVEQDAAGALSNVLDVTDPAAHAGIKNGSIQFTSPSIEPLNDGKGREFGTMFRHFALAATPRNPDQTPLAEVEGEPAMQFSLDDLEPIQMADDDKEKDDDKESDSPVDAPADKEPENPDMPPDRDAEAKQAQQHEAIIANLGQLGVKLPAETDIFAEGGSQVLLAALMTAVESKQTEDTEAEEDESGDPDVTVAPTGGMQFDESDPVVVKLRAAQAKLNAQSRDAVKAQIAAVPLPFVREILESKLETVQFDELGDAQPSMTLPEVAALFDKLPKGMQFSADETTVAEEPDVLQKDLPKGHVSHKQAEEIIRSRGVWREPALVGK